MMSLQMTGQAVVHPSPACDSYVLATQGGDSKERAKYDIVEEP